jgi:hypothetical protein
MATSECHPAQSSVRRRTWSLTHFGALVPLRSPWDEKHQQIFPRRYFMEQICGVFAQSSRSCPIFSDKHLSHSWHDAKWMVERARELDVPFMAGACSD